MHDTSCFKCRISHQFGVRSFVYDWVWKFYYQHVVVLEGIFSSRVSNRRLPLEFTVKGDKYGLLF